MPPSEPPSRRAPARRSRARRAARHWASAWSTTRDRRERRAVRPAGPRMERGRPGRAVATAEQVGAQDADPLGVERPALADERLPPVAGRIGRPGERVDDEDLRRLAGRRAVVPVGRRSARASVVPSSSVNGPSDTVSSRPVPVGRSAGLPSGRRPRSPGAERHPAAPTRLPSAVLSAVAAASACSRSAIRSSTCSRPDRQSDQVRGDAGRRSALRARAASASSRPDG